ncbi:hypothetical protein [Ponticaulis sp.]|uniref:hypothetical protein n=1 Tax=Ponticaulis sp. TaxID=2020902 RepID=UPI000B6E2B68|nr:hypothetical protein [Ponticaulis sp.]MAJ07600.1 hypothetical protein [Ponticaulis sp.]RPG17827.1 MAG: DinB family protein [Hyphomonadaceae bacterium TMED125]HBH91121.1 DinB family protein [Hyphomonadaceae bacterium]HBJ92700.1 DinB family protein [Hyphomonadaceae bacterium]|tara:strand:- start:12184 stop:12696 length:513 start_codon:yes stop_codon:yes gene_type:complete
MPGQACMFDAIEKNLNLGADLIGFISDDQFNDKTVPPYHSSIGCHMRHILDIFDCILTGLDAGKVDLTARTRNVQVETDRDVCHEYLEQVLSGLNDLRSADLERLIDVTDDLGLGAVTCKYTLGALLVQAHSHAIHHFAALGYINSCLGINMPAAEFGYNPTTPREICVG